MQKEEHGLEKKIAELQNICDRLENDPDITLESSMSMFESGLALAQDCVKDLNAMQAHIAELNKQLDSVLHFSLFEKTDENRRI